MAVFMDLKGTSQPELQISKGGPKLSVVVGSTGAALSLKNAAGTDFAAFAASSLIATGDSIVINGDAAGAGADWKMTLARPASGMTANTTYTLPAAPTNGYILSTDGSGNLSWTAPPSGGASNVSLVKTITLGGSSTGPAGTLITAIPANSVVEKIVVVVLAAYNGTNPELYVSDSSVPAGGNFYMRNLDSDLSNIDSYIAHPDANLMAAGGGAFSLYAHITRMGMDPIPANGSVRVFIYYNTPSGT